MIKIISGNSNPILAQQVADITKIPLIKANISTFLDGEINIDIQESVRGEDIFIIQSTSNPVNNNLVELLIAIDALKRGSAKRITAVIPYFGYARQDRKNSPRTPISAKLVANLLTVAGADRILSVDLHAMQIQGFFDIPVDNLSAKFIFIDDIKTRYKNMENVVIVSPDVGGVVRARGIANILNCEISIIDKRRPKPGISEVMNIIGEIKDKHCILIDDMVDSAGTLCNAANALMERGAKEVLSYATHGVFSGSAIDRIEKSSLTKCICTDTILLPHQPKSDKIEYKSIAPLLTKAIQNIHYEKSISELFLK